MEEETTDKGMRILSEDTVKPESWLKMICPICSNEFLYIDAYKPITCQKKECIYQGRELKERLLAV